MIFAITVKHDQRNLKYSVTYQPLNTSFELFTIIAANKTLVIESNRPLFRSKGVKHRKPDFRLKEGSVSNVHFLKLIYEELLKWSEKNLDTKPYP